MIPVRKRPLGFLQDLSLSDVNSQLKTVLGKKYEYRENGDYEMVIDADKESLKKFLEKNEDVSVYLRHGIVSLTETSGRTYLRIVIAHR